MIWKRRQFFRFMGAAIGGGFLRGDAAPGGSEDGASTAPRRSEDVPHESAGLSPHPGPSVDPPVERGEFDVVIVGGGIAGTSAAISAARNGARVALVHERSMLGGNSSSEVRLYPENATAHQVWIKECGIFDEIHCEERVRNHYPYREGIMNCHWDLVLYEWVIREPNITLFLNTHMHRAIMASRDRIDGIYCIQLGSERTFVLRGKVFVDTTGDGMLAQRAGAECRWGRESRSEYGEALAPEQATEEHMGSSLFFRAVDTGSPVPFKRPDWAVEFQSEDEFAGRNHSFIEGGYWWNEVGAPYQPIHDNNAVIHEGLRHLLGVWDHIKNRGEHGAANYGLEFVAFWPYKRECRRIMGDYVLTQQHVQDPKLLEDDVAYGVWFIDIHTHGILDREHAPFASPFADENWDAKSTRCYGIPLRALYSRNVSNLMMAGRPISGSYIAFSSSRVLCTGSVVGQAVGTAAALSVRHGKTPREIARAHETECRQIILRQDGYIPGVVNEDPADLARAATATSSSEAPLLFPAADAEEEMRLPLAQIVPLSGSNLTTVSLELGSTLDRAVELRLGLRRASHVWDFRGDGDVAEARAVIPARHEGWVEFAFDTAIATPGLYYVYTERMPGVYWRYFTENDDDLKNRCPVGVTPATLPRERYWRPIRNGCSFSMKVAPSSFPYGAANVNRGGNRPDMWTNLWMSDASHALPAWLELSWPSPVRFNCVQLVFDTNMNRRVRLPLFRYPECVKDYTLAYAIGNEWRTLHEERGNYMRRRVHRFESVEADRMRLEVQATNGVANARVYEWRVYQQTALLP